MKSGISRGELLGLIFLAVLIAGITIASLAFTRCNDEKQQIIVPETVTAGEKENTSGKSEDKKAGKKKEKDASEEEEAAEEKKKAKKSKKSKQKKSNKKKTAEAKATSAVEYQDPFEDTVTYFIQEE